MSEINSEEIKAELSEGIQGNWDPDITVSEWWKRLSDAGWSATSLPCLLYTSPSPRDRQKSRMPSSA